jgi:hypothetical protein
MLALWLAVLQNPAAPAKPASKPAAKPDAGAEAGPSPQELLKTADEIVKQVAQLRQLPAKGPVKRGVLTRDMIKTKLREQIARQFTSAEIKTEGNVLKAMGLLPAEIDYEKLQLDLLMEQVAGFYDPWGRQLYIADWLPLAMQAPALAHEIAHALQDQHFDLKKFVQAVHDQGDRQLARSALVEGDGTGVMFEFTVHQDLSAMPDMSKAMELAISTGGMGMGGSMPMLDKAPDFIKQSLYFPYGAGLGFVQYIRRRQPWAKVDAVYKKPPDSTEQILHPEKYFAGEKPVWIKAAPVAALKGSKLVHTDTMGEEQIKLFVQLVAGAKNAPDAAAGWGGDRLVAYEPAEGGPYQVVWLTAWDTEADAEEFNKAVQGAWAKPAGKPAGKPSDKIDGASTMKGKNVVVEINVPMEARDAVAADVLAHWKSSKTAPP